MDAEKKAKIREIVRAKMTDRVDSLINDDVFMDNDMREKIWDALPPELSNDEEVNDCMFCGQDGAVVSEVVEAFIDTLTNAFMKRFEYTPSHE